jgi:hypothetical protein
MVTKQSEIITELQKLYWTVSSKRVDARDGIEEESFSRTCQLLVDTMDYIRMENTNATEDTTVPPLPSVDDS